MRVGVVVALVAQHPPLGLEVVDDVLVGLEHVLAGVGRHLSGEVAGEIDRVDHRDAGGLGHPHVVLAEGRGDVHHARAAVEIDEIARDHLEGVRCIGEEREQRRVASADQRGARQRADDLVPVELLGIGLDPRLRHDGALAALGQQGVVRLRVHGEREVRRQRPGRRRPGVEFGRDLLAGRFLQREAHRHGRVLAHAIRIVEPRLEVRQRRLHGPGIGHHAVALVD